MPSNVFGRQLQTALSNMADGVAQMRKRKEQLEKEIARLSEAIAHGGPIESLVQQVAVRDTEPKRITNKLLNSIADSAEAQVKEIRRFVEARISSIRTLLQRDPALAKAELQDHVSEIRMTPATGGEDWAYVAERTWNLLGTGPNAPAFGLAHSDGCGGLQRTEIVGHRVPI